MAKMASWPIALISCFSFSLIMKSKLPKLQFFPDSIDFSDEVGLLLIGVGQLTFQGDGDFQGVVKV